MNQGGISSGSCALLGFQADNCAMTPKRNNWVVNAWAWDLAYIWNTMYAFFGENTSKLLAKDF